MNSVFSRPMMGIILLSGLLMLSACGSSSSSDGSDVGFIQFYNASPNAPAIFLTVDEDLDEDDEDEIERTYTSVSFASVSSRNELPDNTYFIDLAWQDEESTSHDDLEVIYDDQIAIEKEVINFIVIAEDITNPTVLNYSIPVIDDEDDSTDDLFNIRFLNLHSAFGAVDVYVSESSETFNQAVLVDSSAYSELTVNHKLEQDEYTFYLTASGSKEVVFQSEQVTFQYSAQYVLALRENLGVDETPFVIDVITTSSANEYQHIGANARLRAYNGIQLNELIPDYQGEFDFYLNTSDQQATIAGLALGEFSDAIAADYGDYSVALTLPESSEQLLKNHLITLSENADRTAFFYASEEHVDEDGDGNVDENGDGIVDEIEITINSLVVSNSNYQGVFEHNVNIINLIDDTDFSAVTAYFVRSDELIETAEKHKTVPYGANDSLLLLNNTYEVYVVANMGSSKVILASQQLTLGEDSQEQFLVLTNDQTTATGYHMQFVNQKPAM